MAAEDRAPYERILEPVLSDARFEAARATGRDLAIERAIDYALASAT
ncbi:MAG: hypothetical protein ACJ74P_08975 [Gaiellaceae bacterium]|jgi:hypothetical protein